MTLNSQLGALLVFHCAVVLLLLTHTSADSVSCPAIDIIKGADGVLLECKSAGNREAEVLLLDSVGNIISERAKKISSVTLEKKHNNTYTCKLQQDNITQTLQTRVFIQRDTLTPSSCSGEHIALAVLVVCVVLLAVAVFGVWKWKQRKLSTAEMNNETKQLEEATTTTQHNEMEPLRGKETETEEAMTEGQNNEDLAKENAEMFNEEQHMEESMLLLNMANKLKDLKTALKNQKETMNDENRNTLNETNSKLKLYVQNIETQLGMVDDLQTDITRIEKITLHQMEENQFASGGKTPANQNLHTKSSSAKGTQGTSDSI
ncbi:uncharacterized protein LOC143010632 isoform X1 [Genypterus blacodes]|uniref:uncharacterized protein LOC143010632 isoform X1 n=1 Tax=Genypterus blacodes TaxID=154954 RepID=UPI003F771C1D